MRTYSTLKEMLESSGRRFGKRIAVRYVDGSGAYTYAQYIEKCHQVDSMLERFGFRGGDRIAILSQNMPNWSVAFMAITTSGKVAVPILPDSSSEEIDNIIGHSESGALFISRKMMPKLSPQIREKIPVLIELDTFRIMKEPDLVQLDFDNSFLTTDSLAAIIYTSGTSGHPKGVMLSHRNFCHNLVEAYKAQPGTYRDKFLSLLPLSHTYELSCGCLYPLSIGASISYIQRPPTGTVVMSAIKEIRPAFICSVPLIVEKIYKKGIQPKLERIKALNWMRVKSPALYYRLVGAYLRRSFGGKLKFLGVGGAKLDSDVERFFYNIRFPYAIGYGLTEMAPLVCNAVGSDRAVGSIGIPSYGVEVRLDNMDAETGIGELVARGDNVMLGYYREPELTARAIDADGWFHTKDYASMDDAGRYYIRGRMDNMIVGASGENIYPEEIEMVLNGIEKVEESLVMRVKGQLVALVKFEDNALINQTTETVRSIIAGILNSVNEKVSAASRISRIIPVQEAFEKTATHKIRRYRYLNYAIS